MKLTPAWMRTKPRRLMPTGYVGAGGGQWGRVPSAQPWYASSSQLNGIYPFTAGTARPISGAPCGLDLHTGTAVALDHHALYQDGVISSPSMFLFGINGVGKSSTAQTMTLGMMARGMIPAIFNPLKKGEHTPLVEQAGGSVFEFGPNARHQLNLLSQGPLGRAAAQIGGTVGEELRDLAMWKVTKQAQLALQVNRKRPLTDIESAVVEALVKSILDITPEPVTRDLGRAFRDPSPDVLALARADTAADFEASYKNLGDSITAVLSGDLGRLLGGTESIEIDACNRGGFCFDTSAIPASSTELMSTAMLMSWSLGMDSIDAHWELAKAESQKAVDAAAVGDVYVPAVKWSGYTTLMDEFWYPIRSTPGIVDQVDALSRSNRSKGTAEMKVTHSPKDMLSLKDPEDREKARGLAERSGLLGLMALTREDVEELSKIKHLTDKEVRMVTNFNAASSWGVSKGGNRSRSVTAGDEEKKASEAPPGAGKVLFKVEGRPGVPVQMIQTPTQRNFHITDERFRAQRQTITDRQAVV